MAEIQNFRTTFNGFHREDVVHYIEYANARHETEVAQLKDEAQKLREKLHQAEGAQEQVEQLQNRLAAAEASNQEKDQTIAGLEEQLAALREQLGTLEQTVEELQSRPTGTVIPESWTDAELSAYRRAEHTERQAQERATALFSRANGALTDAATQVDARAEEVARLADLSLEALGNLAQAVSQSKDPLLTAAATLRGLRTQKPEE